MTEASLKQSVITTYRKRAGRYDFTSSLYQGHSLSPGRGPSPATSRPTRTAATPGEIMARNYPRRYNTKWIQKVN